MQAGLIPAHVTLCREDEIGRVSATDIELRLRRSAAQPIVLGFGSQVKLDGHGVSAALRGRRTGIPPAAKRGSGDHRNPASCAAHNAGTSTQSTARERQSCRRHGASRIPIVYVCHDLLNRANCSDVTLASPARVRADSAMSESTPGLNAICRASAPRRLDPFGIYRRLSRPSGCFWR